jgi:phosphoglucosamine mutase
VDERGELVDGDRIMAFLARDLHQRGALAGDTLVTTVMSNKALDISCRAWGGRVVRTQVGDRYVLEEMLRGGFTFGGEQSGHMIHLDHSTTGDGSVTMLQALSLMVRSGRPLSELAQCLVPLPQVLVNVEVPRRDPLDSMPGVAEAIRAAEEELGDSGRVLVRYSGTQPLVRIMIEGEDQGRIDALASGIAESVRRHAAVAAG